MRAKQGIAASGIFLLSLGASAWPAKTEAAGVQVRFGVEGPAAGPFPSDLFTEPDPNQNTGLRVNLPKPDCAVRVTDCQTIDVLNTLDGFNLQPRLSIPFTGPVDVNTVTSDTVFLLSLGSTLPGGDAGGQTVGINQVVWDPDTNTLHVESDESLEQHTRYALIVTRGVRDTNGHKLRSGALEQFRHGLKMTGTLAYEEDLRDGLAAIRRAKVRRDGIAALSVFTTQSATAVLEKMRDQIKADTPTPADFLLGPGGTRTVFPLSNISSMLFNRQTGTAPTFAATPMAGQLLALRSIPGVVGHVAFGKYVSPDYETAAKVIPPIDTASGVPTIQSENEIYFNLFLPTGTPPPNGWPVAIFGHGSTGNQTNAFFAAADIAERGIATIAINAVGHGNGPLGTLTVSQTVGGPVTFSAGGRGVDLNGNGVIDLNEGVVAAPPIGNRDGIRQTVVDLLQLVREIEVGMDVDGDAVPDLDPARIYYFGQSLGGMYGTLFLVVEPSVHAGVPNVPGGPPIEVSRLSPIFRSGLGTTFAAAVPSLINVGGLSGVEFNENLPLRDQPPVIDTVPGAIEIQTVLEQFEWVTQAGNSVAYAPHLRKAPLTRMLPKDIIIQFAKGDNTVPNPTTTALLRAGDLADRATYYRHDLAFTSRGDQSGIPVPKDPHIFLLFVALAPTSTPPINFPAVADIGRGAREQIAEFFASDGANVIDPDGAGPLFEVPIAGPLPEGLSFIP